MQVHSTWINRSTLIDDQVLINGQTHPLPLCMDNSRLWSTNTSTRTCCWAWTSPTLSSGMHKRRPVMDNRDADATDQLPMQNTPTSLTRKWTETRTRQMRLMMMIIRTSLGLASLLPLKEGSDHCTLDDSLTATPVASCRNFTHCLETDPSRRWPTTYKRMVWSNDSMEV